MNQAQKVADKVFIIDLVRVIDQMDQAERRVLLDIAEGMVKVKNFYEAKAARNDGGDHDS